MQCCALAGVHRLTGSCILSLPLVCICTGRRPAVHQPGPDSNEEEEEDFWSDSELSAPSRGCRREPALSKPLARSQSLRQGKKKLPAKEVRRLCWGPE